MHRGISGQVEFSLPPGSTEHKTNLTQQAYHSPGLMWNKSGNFDSTEISLAFKEIFSKLQKRPTDLASYAKGLDKCRFLEMFVPEVQNLKNFGRPSFKKLAKFSRTTLREAFVSDHGSSNKYCSYC